MSVRLHNQSTYTYISMSTPCFKKQKTSYEMHFPDEVFRHIASYLVDPYKKDREMHAKIWKTIKVVRYRGIGKTFDITANTVQVESFDMSWAEVAGGNRGYAVDTVFQDLDNVHQETRRYTTDGEFMSNTNIAPDSLPVMTFGSNSRLWHYN